jgi:hypothetical protein
MNKQTAVQFLIEKIDFDANVRCFSKDEWKEIFDQAKQMEREQMKDAINVGFNMETPSEPHENLHKVYSHYNETYGGDNE